jgi:hydroxyacylglutathione hydrolase
MPLKAVIIPVTPFQQNCTLLWCDRTMKGALVDPGGDLDRLLAAVAEHKVTLEKIMVTHGHVDHASGVKTLADRLNLPIEGPHREETFWIDQLPEAAARYGFPPAQAFTPTRWLDDGDLVTVGALEFQVLHCPGHTPGHIVFFHAAQKLAIVGDVIFQGSIGRSDFPRGDFGALVRAIREKLFALGDDVTFIPGHGPLSTFGDERRHNPFVGDAAIARRGSS